MTRFYWFVLFKKLVQVNAHIAKPSTRPGFHWRVAHFILYLVNDGDDTYWVYHVPLSDGGGRLIDLDFWVLPDEQVSQSGRYTREQVVNMATLAGHSMEQIEAALLLADMDYPVDHHDMASMGDKEYEALIRRAQSRLRRWQRHAKRN